MTGAFEEVEPPHWSGSRRWWVLLSFSFLSFTNAFILMDFADDYTLAEEALGLSGPDASSQVAFLYTLFLICVMPAMLFASWGVVNYNWTTMLVGQSSNVICAWLRYAAVRYKSYAIAVVSTVFGGVAGAAVVCSYGVIAETWFRPSQRGLATTVAVQSNYAGWAAGSLLGLVANGDARFFSDTIMLAQAVGVTMCIPLFFGGYRGAPAPTAQEGPVSAGGTGARRQHADRRGGSEGADDRGGERAHALPQFQVLGPRNLLRLLCGHRLLSTVRSGRRLW